MALNLKETAGRASSHKQATAQHPLTDQVPDEDYLCDECRAVDWSSLLGLASGRLLEEEAVYIRPVPKDLEELWTSPCKVCRIVSLLEKQWASAKGGEWWLTARLAEHVLLVPARVNLQGVSQCTVLEVWKTGLKFDWTYTSCLAALTHSGQDDFDVGPRRIVPDAIDYGWVEDLSKICEENHQACANADRCGEILGLRMIDVSARTVIEVSGRCKYVALSYVWGKSMDAQSCDNLSAPPLVIEDAITVAASLGYKYLWVDKYCIPKNATEKHRMISRMDQIYSNAHMTIIAAAGEDAEAGLPGVSSVHRRPPEEVCIQGTTLLHVSRAGIETVRSSKWASRGWTYQESYLSKRRLVFTADEIAFLCNTIHAREAMKQPLCSTDLVEDLAPFFLFVPLAGGEEYGPALDEVLDQIEEYSSREISYDSDSLNAFLGVLHHNEDKSAKGLLYLWGMPMIKSSHVPRYEFYMMWYHTSLPKRRPEFPSWTWAGWAGSVSYIQGVPIDCPPSKWLRPERSCAEVVPEIFVGDEDQNLSALHDFAENLLEKRRINEPDRPGPRQLSVFCAVCPLRFRYFELSRDESLTPTGFTVTDDPMFAERQLMKRPSSGDLAILPLCEGIFVGVRPHLDQIIEQEDIILGLRFPSTVHDLSQALLMVKEVGDGLYERMGLVILDIFDGIRLFDEPVLFMNADDEILDEVSLERSQLFSSGFEERKICLV